MTQPEMTPDWVKDAVFYQIFPDRFASSPMVAKPANLEAWEAPPTQHGFKGGDLLGVVEHLEYLKDLGITAIYFNPIFQSAANHRYHTHDYFRVDPLLGGDTAFETLLEEAHRAGIRVVLDGVFNHASRGFFQFNHILENGSDSPYIDWFKCYDFPLNAYAGKPNYAAWVNDPALPKFSIENQEVRQFIFSIARYWLERGIDGWRLDVPFEINDEAFWREFRQVVKSTNPEAYIVGEIAWEAQQWLRGDQFDAVMNYQFMQACLGFFAGKRINRDLEAGQMGLPPAPEYDAEGFSRRVVELLKIYPTDIAYAQLNLLDSHDMPRFLSLSNGDRASLRLATLFQMTYPGAPCVYSGDEIGITGGRDPDSRRAFPWDPRQWDQELLEFFRQAIALRHAHPALRRGSFIPLFAQGDLLAFARSLADETMLVVLNNGSETRPFTLVENPYVPVQTRWEPRFGNVDSAHETANSWLVPPRSGLVLEAVAPADNP